MNRLELEEKVLLGPIVINITGKGVFVQDNSIRDLRNCFVLEKVKLE